jgi:hypothetical protein
MIHIKVRMIKVRELHLYPFHLHEITLLPELRGEGRDCVTKSRKIGQIGQGEGPSRLPRPTQIVPMN